MQGAPPTGTASDDDESILEPLFDYRCPDPTTASAADPEASRCTLVGEGAGYNRTAVFDMTFGATLVARLGNGDVTRIRTAGAPPWSSTPPAGP